MPVLFSAAAETGPSITLIALLRGDSRAAAALAAFSPDRVREAAQREGLIGLAAERLAMAPVTGPLQTALQSEAARLAVTDLLREAELVAAIAALDAAGIRALVFKGAHLAYTCYERPDLRPRLDSDLLVHPGQRSFALDVLDGLGYERVPQLDADLITYQCTCTKRREGGLVHVIDLHWRIANPQDFGGMLTYDELMAAAAPIPALGASARGPGAVHALLLSLVHPVAHHRNGGPLLWDLDTARLAARMQAAQWPALVALAGARRLSAVCHMRLQRAIDLFAAPVPAHVMLALAGQRGARERARNPRAPHVTSVLASVLALPAWRDRTRLVGQHLFPPVAYMRQTYAPASAAPLAFLYARRVALGAVKWLRRPK